MPSSDPTKPSTPLTSDEALQAMREWLCRMVHAVQHGIIVAGRHAAFHEARVHLDALIARVESDAATPAGRVVEVAACWRCQLRAVVDDVIDERDVCELDAEERELIGDDEPPTWCPLRRGPVTLRLREGEGGE